MGKIILSDPDKLYKCTIDTEVMSVELREIFLGVSFITKHGEKLSVSMRDTGFEIQYKQGFGEKEIDYGWTEFKNGLINFKGKNK